MHPKKERIFTVAVEKFSYKGSTSTTMQEIAKEAGVGKGTLYRYFDNKEDLTSSLMKMGFEEITNDIKEAVSQVDDPIMKLEEMRDVQLQFYNQHQHFCKFLTREIWGYKNKFEENIKEIRGNYTVIIEEVIAQGIESGQFKDVNVETAASSLVG